MGKSAPFLLIVHVLATIEDKLAVKTSLFWLRMRSSPEGH